CNDCLISKVSSSLSIFFPYMIRNAICLIKYFFRKVDVQAMFIDDRQDIDTWIIFMTKDLCHNTFCTFTSFWIFRNIYDNFMTCHSTFYFIFWNENIIRNFCIIWNDKTKGTIIFKSPYDLFLCSL